MEGTVTVSEATPTVDHGYAKVEVSKLPGSGSAPLPGSVTVIKMSSDAITSSGALKVPTAPGGTASKSGSDCRPKIPVGLISTSGSVSVINMFAGELANAIAKLNPGKVPQISSDSALMSGSVNDRGVSSDATSTSGSGDISNIKVPLSAMQTLGSLQVTGISPYSTPTSRSVKVPRLSSNGISISTLSRDGFLKLNPNKVPISPYRKMLMFGPVGEQKANPKGSISLLKTNSIGPHKQGEVLKCTKKVGSCSSGTIVSYEKKKAIQCQYCGSFFSYKQSLRKHQTRKHPDFVGEKQKRKKLKCPECPHHMAMSLKQLIGHLNKMHSKQLQIKRKYFRSEEEFRQWKLDVEKETCSRFILRRGAGQQLRNAVKSSYYCHRSGYDRTLSPNKRKRKARSQGSSKIGCFCTAYMTAYVDSEDKTVAVEYCLDHTGHSFDPAFQMISEELKTTIANKLSQGEDPRDILYEIKAYPAFENHRDSVITIKDIHNIKSKYKISLPENKDKVHLCQFCGFQGKSRYGLTTHIKLKHEGYAISRKKKAIGGCKRPRRNDLHEVSETEIDSESIDIADKPTDIAAKSTDIAAKSTDIAAKPTDIAAQSTDIAAKSTDIAGYTGLLENFTQVTVVKSEIPESDFVNTKSAILSKLHDISQLVNSTSKGSVLQELYKGLTQAFTVASDLEINYHEGNV
ncbi:zinc finger protein [Elysia marginata]|uniref:Zinc finger protein n=1 Tax=Elysia marginata TaxID=1093978 RepID=A0AAV4JIS0_9GAST|nr:zinc finger protein [Elysia marginata]